MKASYQLAHCFTIIMREQIHISLPGEIKMCMLCTLRLIQSLCLCLSPTVNRVIRQSGVNVSVERTHRSEVQTSAAAAGSLSEPGL